MSLFSRVLSLSLAVLLAASLVLSCFFIFGRTPPSAATPPLPQFFSLKGKTSPKGPGVAVLTIYGPIQTTGSSSPFDPYSATGSDAVLRRLDEISRNPDIKGVILRIDSPGGTIGSVQEICQKITEMKNKDIRFTASLADICASGGYYIACQADRIIANPGSLTGSIGVIMNGIDWSELMKKAGVKARTIKSGRHKDIMSPFRPMTREEERILQSVVDDSYDQFLQTVSRSRKIPLRKLKEIADGRIFTGRQALRLGLVDELGNFESAIRAAGKLCGLGDDPVIYQEERSPWESFLSEIRMSIHSALGGGRIVPVGYGPVF